MPSQTFLHRGAAVLLDFNICEYAGRSRTPKEAQKSKRLGWLFLKKVESDLWEHTKANQSILQGRGQRERALWWSLKTIVEGKTSWRIRALTRMVNCQFTFVRKRTHGLHLWKAEFKRGSDISWQCMLANTMAPISLDKTDTGSLIRIDSFNYSSLKAWFTHSYSVLSSMETSSLCRCRFNLAPSSSGTCPDR